MLLFNMVTVLCNTATKKKKMQLAFIASKAYAKIIFFFNGLLLLLNKIRSLVIV